MKIWIIFTFNGKFLLYFKMFIQENLMVEIKTLKIDVVFS